MLFLVRDILDFSQQEAKSFILNIQDIDISKCIQESIDLFRFKADEKRIGLSYKILIKTIEGSST